MKKLMKKFVNQKFLNKFGYEIRKLGLDQEGGEITSDKNQIIAKCLKYSMINKLGMWALIN